MGITFPEIAKSLNLALNRAYRTFSILYECSRIVEPATSRIEMRILDQLGELYVIGLILNSPTLYLGEIVQMVKNDLEVDFQQPLYVSC